MDKKDKKSYLNTYWVKDSWIFAPDYYSNHTRPVSCRVYGIVITEDITNEKVIILVNFELPGHPINTCLRDVDREDLNKVWRKPTFLERYFAMWPIPEEAAKNRADKIKHRAQREGEKQARNTKEVEEFKRAQVLRDREAFKESIAEEDRKAKEVIENAQKVQEELENKAEELEKAEEEVVKIIPTQW